MSGDTVQPQLAGEAAPEAPSTSATTNTASEAAGVGSRVTKNGSVSKMRSHRGNVPTLPQTKFCPLCPARFTRTTHLNRHLKTHSNERLHECDRCHAQFTRSDLLTRHKRTCADSSANRSRRKSCQNCADSKVKCDLGRPCTKCKARGRECVYLNTPGIGSNTEACANNSQDVASSPEVSTVSPSTSSTQPDSSPEVNVSPQTSNSSSETVSNPTTAPDLLNHPPPLSSFSIPADPLDLNTTLPVFNTSALVASTAGDPESPGEKSYLTELFSSEMYDNLFSGLFTSSFQKNPTVPGHHFNMDSTSILTDRLEFTTIDQAIIEQYFGTHNASLAMYPNLSEPAFPSDPLESISEQEIIEPLPPPPPPTDQTVAVINPEMPTVAEYYQFVMAFLTTYAWHMPIVHVPTFLMESRHPALVKASKACGAMYSGTQAATNFIDRVLATVRDDIIADLSHATDYDTIIQLTLASVMVQTIGMFHKNPEQRAKSNVYHGMIVMMLRMNGFVEKTRDWKLPEIDFNDPVSVQTGWREWVRHESAKRALWICYLHDCCHSIYFNLSPTFHTEQFTLGLPAEDGLWTAKDATEWAALLNTPSPYGNMEVRLRGTYLKALYFYLAQNNPSNEPRPFHLTPFGHFLMIHAMMRKLFEMYLRDRLQFHQPGDAGGRPKLNPHFVDKDRVFHVQILLHYWLQSWLQSPETPRDVPESQQRFCFNALPFYWLAQAGLVAYQEGLPPFDPEGTYISSHELKFSLVKKWEKHIRKFLETNEQTPTMFWDEVMKGRIDSWQQESGFEYSHLLGFFHPRDPATTAAASSSAAASDSATTAA
ncbi:hypothetical protein BD309DRAFT_594197 [Dichomitus squalens]|uniref:Uncharacterized protein n=1 Tax=Dichomitus squalens TaxID=114155 RepID=A0A4Q9NDX8_9APHY|nr:hypothetical protein BD309DRAFT_594197 [Dichomitus squalens]TBU64250.1 hypothetical protein BD310DRAFT_1034829 [Dichomitus squalens]